MVWIIIPLVFIVLVVFYLITAPLILEIDSTRNLYQVRMHFLARARLQLQGSSLMLYLNIAGWRKGIDLLQQKRMVTPATQWKVKKLKTRTSGMSLKRIMAVLKTFRVRTCIMHLDSGDVCANGMLFPVCYGLSAWTGKDIRVNFLNENSIKLEVRNSIVRILWAYLRA